MKNKRLIIGISTLVLVVAGVLIYLLSGNDTNDTGLNRSESRSQLTGNQVDATAADRPILGVIIENTPPARPQTGLNNAGIVFEAVTEGGITRYLALYQEDDPEIVGPVRSLRVDTLDWVMGFDASVAHVGGRPKALDLADERDAKSLNQFDYDEPYYRDDSRDAPHNMYARVEGLRELQNRLGHDKSRFEEIPRSKDNPSQNPEADSIAIDFSGPQYKTEFRYDPSTNTYTRYLAGDPHTSSDANSPITVKNLVVITLPADRTTDDGALGDGEALVFKDGNVIKARWKKSDYQERIKIVDDENNEIQLNRGKTWISALPSDKSATY